MRFFSAMCLGATAAALFVGGTWVFEGTLQAALQVAGILVAVWVGLRATSGAVLP